MNMIGPGVSRTDEQAIALVHRELDQHRGSSPVSVIPMQRENLVRAMYGWGPATVRRISARCVANISPSTASACPRSCLRPAEQRRRPVSIPNSGAAIGLVRRIGARQA